MSRLSDEGCNVEKSQFIRTSRRSASLFDRIARVHQGYETDPFDHAAGIDVEAKELFAWLT